MWSPNLDPQVPHGLILLYFVKRWLGFWVSFSLQMMPKSKDHIDVTSSLDAPAFYVGMAPV